ncbi:MAG: insulinase family protein [Saprospiraceae bacterium]|nr:insulinase family protein [Saprospiraceae bacterium]
MKKTSFFSILSLLLIFACSPKTGDKTTATDTNKAPVAAATGKAPKIPMPTGNVRAAAPNPGDAPKIQIGKAETFQLENGLTVIVVENHKLPRVSYRIFVDSDPVMEKEAAGYVSMMGDLLTKGTTTRTKSKIDEEVDFIGASLYSDANGLSGASLSKHTDKLLEVMSDVLLNPVFPEEELEKAKRRSESDLASQKDDANAIAGNVANILRYGKGHPYGEVMTEATLEKINLDQIRKHYQTYFKPNISYLVVTGDITRAKAETQAKKYFGKWTRGEVPEHNYTLPRAPEKTQVDFVNKPGAVQSVVNITYPVELAPGTPDVIRSRLMNAVLGGYFNSRININLRENKAYTYGARSALSPDELVGSFNATASVRNAVTDSSIIEFMKELSRMRIEKVPQSELQVVKNVLSGQFSQSLEEPGTVANFALNTARFKLPADYYEKYLETLQSVTAEEVLSMAKKYIRPDNAHILVVGNKEEVADKIKVFSPEGKVNFYDIYGDPVKNVNTNIPAGVTAQSVVQDYINAIGGMAKIAELKDVYSNTTMKSGGPSFVIQTWQKGGTKLAFDLSMNGQSMSKRIYNGVKAIETGMGGAQQDLTGSDLLDIQEQAAFCKEAAYLNGSYKINLKNIEELNGKAAYVLEVERADGNKVTEYYDVETSLKVREITMQEGQDGTMQAVVTDFSDYKEINGVRFPHTLMLGGIFPVPMKATVNEIKINQGIEDSMFTLK